MTGSTQLMQPIEASKVAKYARFLVGSYRLSDAEDGEVIARGLIALLGGYPEWVVSAVCDPRSGLPVTSKHLPNLFEVRAACDAKMRPTIDAERRRRIQAAAEADAPVPVDEAAAARRKAFIAEWRTRQAIDEACAAAGNNTPLEDMDARGLHGEHRELVAQALDAEIARLQAASIATPMRLSSAALKSLGIVVEAQVREVAS